LLLAIVLLLANSVNAVIISEIMYNPAGSDTNREWVELYNPGDETINIEGWKLRENNANRNLVLQQGSFEIPPEGFIIIIRDYKGFIGDYPGYNGSLVSCSFVSLVNTGGEELSIIDIEGNTVNSLFYIPFAPEGYSIEINDSSIDNTKMDNWVVGPLNGDPGNIRKKIIEDSSDKPNMIPEFGSIGLVFIILTAALLISRRS
jgi:hypothetical protein